MHASRGPSVLATVAARILAKRAKAPATTCLLVALSGIDGSGKTTLSHHLEQELSRHRLHTAVVSLDAWHTPPATRFSAQDPAGHFYRHAFRFEELFRLLVEPLRQTRSIQLTVELTRLPEND
ncbi:MAG: hypothetical protein ACR2PL_20105, partial [Dehalococcoidia bacterium]